MMLGTYEIPKSKSQIPKRRAIGICDLGFGISWFTWLRHGGRTCMRGRFKWTWLDNAGSARHLAAWNKDPFNMDRAWQGLNQVQDRTKETGFLLAILLIRACGLEFNACAVRGRAA